MKTRLDFVSNSSSCSFILSNNTGTLASGLKFFSDTFKQCYIPFDITDKIEISFSVKNKWFKDVYELVRNEKAGDSWSNYYTDWRTGATKPKDPEELSWNEIEVTMDRLSEIGDIKKLTDKIENVRFKCEDSDTAGIIYLRLLYSFFERNEFCPDASDTENNFITDNDDNFIKILATTSKKDKANEVHG